MEYFIDTNIFLRVLEFENKKIFEECAKVLELVRGSKIKAYTSTTVLAETVWVLTSTYHESKAKIAKGLSGIIKLNNLKIIDSFDLERTIELFSKYSVKFIDALIATNPKIQSKKCVILSYDKDFDKLGVIRKEPQEIIEKLI